MAKNAAMMQLAKEYNEIEMQLQLSESIDANPVARAGDCKHQLMPLRRQSHTLRKWGRIADTYQLGDDEEA